MLIHDVVCIANFSSLVDVKIVLAVLAASVILKFAAKRVGAGTRRKLFSQDFDFQEARLLDYPKLDRKYYARRLEEAEALGMWHVTDFTNMAAPAGAGIRETLVRVMASPQGEVTVFVYDSRSLGTMGVMGESLSGGRRKRSTHVQTAFDNGECLVTTDAKVLLIEGMEWQNVQLVAEGASLEHLIGWHRVRLKEYLAKHPGVRVLPVSNVGEFYEREKSLWARKAEIWQAKDWKLKKADLKQWDEGEKRLIISEDMLAGQPAGFEKSYGAAVAAASAKASVPASTFGTATAVAQPAAETQQVVAEPELRDSEAQTDAMESVPDSLPKEWYFSQHGQNHGPMTKVDLQERVWKPGVNYRSILVWNPNMPEWKSLVDVPALRLEKPASSGPVKPLSPAVGNASPVAETAANPALSRPANPYETPGAKGVELGQVLASHHRLKYSGMGRKDFAIWMLMVLPCIYWFQNYLTTGPLMGTGLNMFVSRIAYIVFILVAYSRVKNLGMSWYWLFGVNVPFLNAWIFWRAYCCPEGYADHTTMDGTGKTLSIIYWILTGILYLAAIAVIVAAAFWLPDLLDGLMGDGGYEDTYEQEYWEEYEDILPAE
ncbi:hypothetical protein Rhal01_02073 [Rubritalea halochordaticola]|uniref:GYF domain-containing protein n=1 Tax=Rubritalea halochordaticola TaxID=714537 RepID=A0ABP9V5J3_9BACT